VEVRVKAEPRGRIYVVDLGDRQAQMFCDAPHGATGRSWRASRARHRHRGVRAAKRIAFVCGALICLAIAYQLRHAMAQGALAFDMAHRSRGAQEQR
jgi:hypothetical protein